MIKKKWLLSILTAIISVAVLQFFIQPVYTSDDDALYMLTLSGGLGNEPTNLLHVTYGWHPFYGWPVKTLFIHFPHVNWYTIFLLGFHVAGLSAVCFFLQHRLNATAGLLFYFILFALFETRLLQNPDFSGSALINSVGGCLLLSLGNQKRKYLYTGCVYVLCSLLLRFHISALMLLLFIPLLFFPIFSKGIKNVFSLLIVMLCWFLLHLVQIEFYKRQIPDWENKAAFRDAFFYLTNHTTNKQKQLEIAGNAKMEMLGHGFLYDTTIFNTGVLTNLSQQTNYRNPFHPNQRKALYWSFVNNRIYLALLFLTAVLLLFTNRSNFFKRIIYLLLPLSIWLYLLIFMKGTTTIQFAFFISIFFYLLDGLSFSSLTQWRFLKWYVSICAAFLLLWSVILAAKVNRQNTLHLLSFSCMTNLLQKNSTSVFVASEYDVALKYFPAWQSPYGYELNNLLYYQRLLVADYVTILEQHGIPGPFPTWLLHKNIYLAGKPPELLPQYFFHYYGLQIKIVEHNISNCMKIYKVLPAEHK